MVYLRKKKVLVQGTADSLQKFFSNAVSYNYETVAILSEDRIAIELDEKDLDVFTPQALPKLIYGLVDGVVLTCAKDSLVKYFFRQGLEPRKIFLWNAEEGWGNLTLPHKDGTQVVYFCGLEFHIRNEDDLKFFNEIFWRLQSQWQVKNLSPQLYPVLLEERFQQRTGRLLDLNNPQTLTEKIQWLKIFDATPIKSRLADKYAVRSWIAEKIGDEYLIPLLGVWEDFDDIDFNDLPNQFVLKCNHGWNMNIIVRDKKTFDKRNAREKINAWLAVDFGAQNLELHYSRIKSKIIAEKFMTNTGEPDIIDYKFWCFNGHVEYVQLDRARSTNHVQRFYSVDWKPLSFIIASHKLDDKISEKPPQLEKMLNIAQSLSAGFSIVRVDLYCVKDRIYFGEMTFTPLAGNFSYNSESINEYLGSLLKLPDASAPPRL